MVRSKKKQTRVKKPNSRVMNSILQVTSNTSPMQPTRTLRSSVNPSLCMRSNLQKGSFPCLPTGRFGQFWSLSLL